MKNPVTLAREEAAALVRSIGETAEADAIESGDRDHNYPSITEAKITYLREVSWKAGFITGVDLGSVQLGDEVDMEQEWQNYASLFEPEAASSEEG